MRTYFGWQSLKGRYCSQDRGVDRRTILKRIPGKFDWMFWMGLIWLKIQTGGGWKYSFGTQKRRGIWLAVYYISSGWRLRTMYLGKQRTTMNTWANEKTMKGGRAATEPILKTKQWYLFSLPTFYLITPHSSLTAVNVKDNKNYFQSPKLILPKANLIQIHNFVALNQLIVS
jgi:hypothetical protein